MLRLIFNKKIFNCLFILYITELVVDYDAAHPKPTTVFLLSSTNRNSDSTSLITNSDPPA